MTSHNKIIFLIAPPRSLSTAFLRMMNNRGDFKVFNEPSSCVFNQKHYPHSKIFYSDQASVSYQEVKRKIISAAKDNNIFVKEMSFAFEELIASQPDLITHPNIFFIFLLRDPHHCIISYYKKLPSQFLDFLISEFATLTGYRALYKAFKRIQNENTHMPHIIHAQQLHMKSMNTISAFCKYADIPYMSAALNWSHLGEQFTGFDEWDENKKMEFTHHWHDEAIYSQRFHQPAIYEVDVNGNPTFSEISNATHRKKCIEIFKENKVFYNKLMAQAQKNI